MRYESKDKMVSHPAHYQSGKFEVIDIIEEFTKDLVGVEAVDTGNAIKYVLRWHKKNGKQDIEKAIWYLTHLVKHLEDKENEESRHEIFESEQPPERSESGTRKICGTCDHSRQYHIMDNTVLCTKSGERRKHDEQHHECWAESSDGDTDTDPEHICTTCKYEHYLADEEPCRSCIKDFKKYGKWQGRIDNE